MTYLEEGYSIRRAVRFAYCGHSGLCFGVAFVQRSLEWSRQQLLP